MLDLGQVSKETIRNSDDSPERVFLSEGLKQKTLENEALRTEIFVSERVITELYSGRDWKVS